MQFKKWEGTITCTDRADCELDTAAETVPLGEVKRPETGTKRRKEHVCTELILSDNNGVHV